jgi:adenosyl cobinamide kinase/adenosyl cobinamide phosphate guanylyltransferase
LPEGRLTFVLGGARSGKSRHAEELVSKLAPPWTYIATAQAYDDEMRERIAHHRARRDGRWITLDAPLDLAGALAAIGEGVPVLIDCLTLWLSNRILAEDDVEAASAEIKARADIRRIERSGAEHRAGQRARAAIPRCAGAAQPADGGDRRHGDLHGRRPAHEGEVN